MDLFVSWKTTWDAEDPKFAVMADDSEALRRKSQAMEAGKRIIESWLLRVGGEVINFDGADGHCQVPANELTDLERIRVQYSQTLGTAVRVAVGVGIKLSEADQALKAAFKQGGDRIVLYTPQEGDDDVADGPALSKAEPAKNPSTAGGGIQGASRPQQAAAAQKPKAEGSEHSQAEAEQSLQDNAPPSGELTHSAADAEKAFEDHADKADDDEKSADDASGKADADSDLKKEVLKVLQHVKTQAPALQQLTASEPKLYAAIQETIHAMLMLAKRVVGTGDQAPMAKSEVAEYLRNKMPVAVDKDPVLKADRFFVRSAFLGKNGEVVTTGSWHDIEQLPEGFEIAEEGFVDGAGQFYDRRKAIDMATAVPMKKSEKIEAEFHQKPIETSRLDKTEFKSKDGIVIPAKYHPARRAYDKAHIKRITENPSWQHMDMKPTMVQIKDLAHASSGNMAVNKDRYNLYRRMLSAGDRLPPIVIRRNGMKYDIVDGSHRVQAILDHNGHDVNKPPKVPEMHAIEMSSRTSNKPTPMVPPPKKKVAKNDEPMDKKLPLPENAPTHTAHTYPVGAVKDHSPQGTRDVGKVKVAHENGKTGWVSVRAGMVLSQDGHPISSRNPGGK